MLAVKFYHLKALIHRPYLSSSKIVRSCSNPTLFFESERQRIYLCEKRCIAAAQQTARLLHNVEDKKSLVHGFPWWQMISCLICASSILLVASICIDRKNEAEDIDWAAVEEDAEVCLTVFQALSTNSNAARLARDMMQGLKETRIHLQCTLRFRLEECSLTSQPTLRLYVLREAPMHNWKSTAASEIPRA